MTRTPAQIVGARAIVITSAVMRDDHLRELEARRAKLADDADLIAVQLELWPDARLRRMLEAVVMEINRIDVALAAARSHVA
jgi:hypothetical protein